MRVLLINPPDELEEMFGVGKAFVQKYEPLGLLYIAAVARAAQFEVSVVDAHAQQLDLARIQAHILQIRPAVIGISTLTCSGNLVFKLGQWIRSTLPNTLVVLGNIHASVFAEAYLRHNCCQVVVHGEAEHVFTQLLRRHEAGASFEDVPSISFLRKDALVQTSSAAVVDLEKLPPPARDLVDQRHYFLTAISNQSYVTQHGSTAKTMVTSRGCPHRCTFCVVHRGQKPRYASVQQVVDELQMLQEEYATGYVYIMDALFMGNKGRLLAICDEIRRRRLTVRWGCDAHVSQITPELISSMAGANCYELSLGIESGVQYLLDAIGKKITLERVVSAVHTIKNNSNIQLEGLFILGLPGERRRDSLETIRFAKSLPLDMAQFSILCPYPGSPLFEELAARGEIDTGVKPDGTVHPAVWKRYSSYICFTDLEPIWVTPTQTVKQLRRLQKRAQREFYLRPAQVWRQARRVRPNNILQLAKIAWRGFF